MIGASIDALAARIARLEAGTAPSVLPERERFAAILAAVADDFGVTVDELRGENRSANLALPRHAAMALGRRLLGYSHPRIGRLLNRDHSTVMHGIRRITALAADDPELAARLDRLAAALSPQPKKGRRA